MRTTRLGLAARPAGALAALLALAAAPAGAQTALPAPAVAAASNGVGTAFELAFWQSVTGSEDAASYQAYLDRYPDGTFSGLARARIAAIQRGSVQSPPAPAPAAVPVPEPQAVPAVLTAPSASSPLAPAPAVAVAVPAPAAPPAAAEVQPAAAPAPQAAPSPIARLLAQLRGSGDVAASVAPAAAAPQAAPPPPAAAAPAISYASARPLLLPVPEITLPAYFCSNDARNAFHNTTYRPAVEAATRNNEAAVAYLRQLQQTYDRGQLGRDTAALNAIAAEARAYQSEAARAYSVQAALVRQFDALMAVPLHTCMASAQ